MSTLFDLTGDPRDENAENLVPLGASALKRLVQQGVTGQELARISHQGILEAEGGNIHVLSMSWKASWRFTGTRVTKIFTK